MSSHQPIKYNRIFLAGIVTAIVFIVVELIVEQFTWRVFGINEVQFMQSPGLTLAGTRYHVINILTFVCECFVFMWVYAVLLYRFNNYVKAALGTSFLFLLIMFLVLANMLNMGAISSELALIIIIFNLIELPAAVFAGGKVYKNV